MAQDAYLSNQFLVAMPGLVDPNFNHSVTLLCEHNEQGALGLVINRPTELRLVDMLDHMKLARPALDPSAHLVHWGGPVQTERGFVIHSQPGTWESSLKIADELYITTSKDVLSAIGQGEGPKDFLVTLGYAGWGAGQLESEMAQNAWLSVGADDSIIFDVPPEERYPAALKLLGIDPVMLAGDAGHA